MSQTARIELVPRKQRWLFPLLGFGAALLLGFSLVRLDLAGKFGWTGVQKAAGYALQMLQFDFTGWQDILLAALESISVAITATVVSAIFAFFTSFLAASNVSVRGVPLFFKGLAATIRAVPTLIWALIFVAFLGFGPFAGVLGLCFHSYAYLVKAFSESIEEVDAGCLEALRATGASWSQTMARGVVPTIKTSIISWTALRFEVNIGQSSILGLVGAGGIGHELSLNMRMFEFGRAGFVLFIVFLMSFSVEMLFNKLKINVDKTRRKA